MFPGSNPGQGQSATVNLIDELPKTVSRTLDQGSLPTSMDFHPIHQTLLLGQSCKLVLIYLLLFWMPNICLSSKLI